ncbi:MAG: RES family NAD+ phosphorylase [Solirubrobacteraceae bacterium]
MHRVAELTTSEALAALGLPAAQPTADQWPAFQDVGEQLHHAGYDGVVYRSAARPDGLCVCVFRATPTDTQGRVRPLPSPQPVSTPPTPPRGLRT